MFIGHLPTGYITASLLWPRCQGGGVQPRTFFTAAILGALAPDVDLFWFFLVDHRQHHHHAYFTHFPLVWASLLLASLLWLRTGRDRPYALLACVGALGGFVHLMLDSVVGDVRWLAPFSDRAYALFTVPARLQPWWLNFFLHWSFAFELALTGWALWLYRRPGPGQTARR